MTSRDCESTQARRLYLTRRRREILAPALALRDIVDGLLADETFSSVPDVLNDLDTVQRFAGNLIQLLDDALDPAQAETDSASKAVNHDARNLLAVIVGYADELRQRSLPVSLGGHHAEFELTYKLGKRTLALVDSTVHHLRSPDGVLVSDTVQTYLERGDDQGSLDEVTSLTSSDPGLILVVEDHDRIRRLLCDLLCRQGHEVVTASDGQEALNLVATRAFDLVITDIEMPRVNGFQLLDQLKGDSRFRDIPVIVVSGHGELDSLCRGIKAGAEDYLPKPYNQVILKARIDTCLEKKRLRDRNDQQRRRYNDLLHSILPSPIVAELAENDTVRPRRRERVAVLFADIVGFTPFCNLQHDRPEVIVHLLRQIFEQWEDIANSHNILKIKTIGDAFMASGGLLDEVENPVLNCVLSGLSMIRATRSLLGEDGRSIGWDLRVGVHVGPVVAGLLGRRQSLLDLWGDTVNIAARLESHGLPGQVNLSNTAWRDVSGHVRGETRTKRILKGTENEWDVIHLDPELIQVIGVS